MTQWGIEPATFRLVAQFFNQLRHQQSAATYNYVQVRKQSAVCSVVLDTPTQRGKLSEYKRVRHYSLQRLLATSLLR